jgi:hypothetical protein
MSCRFAHRLLFVLVGVWLLGGQPRTGVAGPHAPEPAALPEIAALRAAVEDLSATFGDRYPAGPAYLARLGRIEAGLSSASEGERAGLLERLAALRREALLASPMIAERPIVFIARPQYKSDHHNTATMFQTGEINQSSFRGGAAIRTIDLARGGRTATLWEVADGMVRDLEVRFDGRQLMFALRRDEADDYHVYTMDADGSGLRQITFGAGLSDIDPMYLPDGRIVLASTREPKYCMCNRHIMCNLFVMEADGANLQQIGHSTLFEGHPSLLPDGRVLYDRWEYVDRNFGDAQGLWTCNPDGTSHAVYYGNNTNSPGAVLDARAIPGTELVVATFSSCHDRPWGALAVVDRRRGVDGRAAVVRTWPPEAIDLVGVGNYDTFKRVEPKYEDPWPLADSAVPQAAGKYFLAARTTGRGEQTGIVLVDIFGNEVIICDRPPGCFDPMPLGPRPAPPVLPGRTDLAAAEGRFYVADVYVGTGMEAIPRGTVKRLRVVESPEKRFWTQSAWDGGTGQQAPGMAWDDFNNKRILGTVPVEADGSAYFAVPADRFVYFQLLDERGMMVQSMRSGTIVRPGETAGCAGCHEGRRQSVPGHAGTAAWLRGPRRLQPWHGPPRNFSYTADVQPVLDRSCVGCHDYGTDAGATLNLAGDLGLLFNTSYVELRGKRYVKVVGAGPTDVQPPMSWGSHASRLGEVLLRGHGDPEIDRQVELDSEGFDRIVTWIDLNAPYYPEYASVYRDNLYGRSPLSRPQLDRLGELTGAEFSRRQGVGAVDFTRPELSPCLASLRAAGGSKYGEALAIIEAGRRLLAERPRADMPGFRLLSPEELRQQARYDARLDDQRRSREAIVRGARRYERP